MLRAFQDSLKECDLILIYLSDSFSEKCMLIFLTNGHKSNDMAKKKKKNMFHENGCLLA